jgi:hypothetical protein
MNLGISQTYQNEVIKNEEKGVQDMDCKCNHLRKGISGLGIRQEGVVRTGANQKAQPLYTRSRPIRPCLVLVMQDKTKTKTCFSHPDSFKENPHILDFKMLARN